MKVDVTELRAWAHSRIEHCQSEERKFGFAYDLRTGPPQDLVEAWTERRALVAVLNLIDEAAAEERKAARRKVRRARRGDT